MDINHIKDTNQQIEKLKNNIPFIFACFSERHPACPVPSSYARAPHILLYEET